MIITKNYCTADMKVSGVVKDNPLLLLVLENFNIHEFSPVDSIEDVCKAKGINKTLFLNICNLHNGFYIDSIQSLTFSDLPDIIHYLKRGHIYYQQEKYPEIIQLIKENTLDDRSHILKVLEDYFNEYFEEVKEHIYYEEQVAFPYFLSLLQPEDGKRAAGYSSKEYQEHHTDIESRLNAFKDILIQYVHPRSSAQHKRKLLMSLAELEFELKIHSFIEDVILLPLTRKIEEDLRNG